MLGSKYFAESKCPSYIQGNTEAMEQLIDPFSIQFSRSRTNFLDWTIGSKVDIDSHNDSRYPYSPKIQAQEQPKNRRGAVLAWQTAFWRPVFDSYTDMIQTAFGMEYMIPQSILVANPGTQEDSQNQTPSFLTTSPEEDRLQSNNNYQRLSVYIQLKGDEHMYQQLPVSKSKRRGWNPVMTKQDTCIVFDSMNKQAMTDELISGGEPWRELTDQTLVGSTPGSNDLAVAAIHLLFDAIAGKWSDYILRMHGFISALAEDIYDQPENDEPTSALWRVSKQLLQAERLLKSHVQLAETVQVELMIFTRHKKLDWLHQDLEEF